MAAKTMLNWRESVNRKGSVLWAHIWVFFDSSMKEGMSPLEWLSGRRLQFHPSFWEPTLNQVNSDLNIWTSMLPSFLESSGSYLTNSHSIQSFWSL